MPRFKLRNLVTCLKFNATTSIVNVSSIAAQNDLTAQTISFWTFPISLGENNAGRIFSKGTGLSSRIRVLCEAIGTGRWQLFAQWTASGGWVASGNSIQFGKWQHVVITYDASSSSNDPLFYINGTAVSVTETNTPSGSLQSDTTDLVIGNDTTTARTFSGFIDEVMYFNRIITPTEVSDLYYKNTISNSGLVGYWKFDEGSGSSAIDSSTSATNGTIANATYSTVVAFGPRTLIS